MNLFQRLKERKLVQWTAAYLAGAWLTLEVFSTLQEGLGWSPLLFRGLVALLVLGLIVTVVVAWYHGEQGRQRVSAAELVIIAGLLLVAGLLSSRLYPSDGSTTNGEAISAGVDSPTASDAASGNSIAVLPFANRSDREEDQHFVDGIHDEVLTQLNKIRSLEVKSRTSVLQYRNPSNTVREIGEELGARYIVEGGVQRAGATIRINVSLVDALDDERLWDGSYEDDLTVANLLALQRRIALEVATELGAEILPGERTKLNVQAPENMVAYEQYLEGLYHFRTITLGERDGGLTYDLAIESFEAAIAAEPDWAPPRAALGRVYHFKAGWAEPSVNFPQSRAALDAALRLDSLHAPAWASLGYVLHNWERDFVAAEEAYRKASALGWRQTWGYALLLESWGRFDEAIAAFEQAASLDPLSPWIEGQLGRTQLCAGNYDPAIDRIKHGLAMQGEQLSTLLAEAYFRAFRTADALAQLDGIRRLGFRGHAMAFLYALADSTERAEALLAETERDAPSEVVDFQTPAATAMVLGQPDRALDYLERTAESDPIFLLYMRCNDEVRSLAGNPRYERVLDLVGFPDDGTGGRD